MKLAVEGVNELVLEVKSMDRAVEFWSKTLGFQIVEEWGYDDHQFSENDTNDIWATWLYVGGNTRLGLWLPRNFTEKQIDVKEGLISEWDGLYDEGGKNVHFALYIKPENFDGAINVLKSEGIDHKILIFDDKKKEKSVYFKDTEHNVIELYTLNIRKEYS